MRRVFGDGVKTGSIQPGLPQVWAHAVAAALLLGLGAPARAEVMPPPAEYHPSRVLVQLAPSSVASAASIEVAEELARSIGGGARGDRVVRSLPLVPNLVAIEVGVGGVHDAIDVLREDARVLFAEPDYKLEFTAVPNEPAFRLQWGMQNTGQTASGDPGTAGADANVVAAWDFLSTAPGFRIGVVDSGLELAHPDIRNNLWINEDETAGDGVDDDGNGFIDDVHGFNVVSQNGDVSDVVGHGTHVAGIIAARGNNGFGVAGMVWDAELVIVRLTDETGGAFISDAITAINYLVLMGVSLSNNSWGCYQCESQSLQSAIGAAGLFGHLFVASAGNGVFGLGIDAEAFPFYPASYDLPNIISVTASDNDDRKPKFANFGRESVDLAAPGVSIYSTAVGPNYEFRTGTSMAAPMVTGTAALIWSQDPSMGYQRVKDRILLTARPVPAFEDSTVSGGMLDVSAAVADCNGNGILDTLEISDGSANDCNRNSVPDECEPDCNGNGTADACDVTLGGLADCNGNEVPDECEADCNGNGLADDCDLAAGLRDCNENGIPDVCEPGNSDDCNDNGFADLCDIGVGRSFDCNENFVPDECDIAEGTSFDCGDNGLPDECERDCNGNGVADGCDIALGDAVDEDGDGVPDECSLGFVVRPVTADRPFAIDGDEIAVVQGESIVTFEVVISGWDPEQDGDRRLRAYQVGLDPEGLVNNDGGALELANVPCNNNEDCLSTSECEADRTCDATGSSNVDETRSDYVFADIGTVVGVDPSTFRVGVAAFFPEEAPIDPGEERYAATFILRVPPDAAGVFTISPLEGESFMSSGSAPEDHFDDVGLIGARLRISPDCNENGFPDDDDIALGISDDCDADGIPDECVEERNDCNGNVIPDVCDIESGASTDCNGNGVPDECLAFEADCNGNEIPDACDVLSGHSEDCNENFIPDECLFIEDDCNENGTPDACDIADGTAFDCDENGVPDVCGSDCNGNELADSCDIAAGRSADAEGNGIPDECQTPRRVPQDYATIQDAVFACDPGDPIVLSQGTYTGFGNTYVEFFGKVLTVVCPPSQQPCIVDADGEGYAFFFFYGEDRRTILDGLTIRNARDSSMIVLDSSPTIRRCIIEENGPAAAGVQIDQGSSPLFDRCIIRNNAASFSGGGIRSDSSFPVILNTIVEGNFAGSDGGGIYAINGRIEIYNSVIRNNFAQRSGGGVAIFQDMSLIRNTEILGNTADPAFGPGGDGGGIWLDRSDASIEGCAVTGNFAVSGGGIYVKRGDPLISNTTIADNDAANFGGGLFWIGSTSNTVSCCSQGLCDNSVTRAGCEAIAGTVYPDLSCADVTCGTQSCCRPEGGCENLEFLDCVNLGGEPRGIGTQCASDDCAPSVANTILWGNSAIEGREIHTGSSVLTIADSTVSGGFDGDNIHLQSPLFVDRGVFDDDLWIAGDYSLLAASPVIDQGNDARVPSGLIQDLGGAPRRLCARVDQGAYEHGAGDFDCDGVADLADFAAWEGCMTGPAPIKGGLPHGCDAYDLNVNGRIDLEDFSRLALTVLFPPA